MSRSYKKNKITKDPSNSKGKKEGSKRFRRKSKSKLKLDKENELLNELPKDKSEVINDYNVVDYFIYWDQINDIFTKKILKGKNKKLFK